MSGPSQTVRALLERLRLGTATETAAQEEIANALAGAGIAASREHRLSARDRVDFFAEGVAIEVKIGGGMSPREILRQLERYAEHDDVHELVLVSSKAMGLPSTIKGKPAFVVSVGRAWL